MNINNKDELTLAKNHFDLYQDLPLETVKRLFELAGKALEPAEVTTTHSVVGEDKVVVKKTAKSKA